MSRRAVIWAVATLLAACSEEPIVTPARDSAAAQAPPRPQRLTTPGRAPASSTCATAPAFESAARANTASLQGAAWAVFGRPEPGWAVYAPLVAHEIGTACAPETSGFAAALARWQSGAGLPADGVMTEPVLQRLKAVWHGRRPFVAAFADGACPPSPPEASLVTGTAPEGYGGEIARLRPEVLTAWRALVSAARSEAPGAFSDPDSLKIFSSYRSPAEAQARCGEHGCDGVVRTWCSAHGTGTAIDVVVGAAPGMRVDNSDDVNRLHMTGTPAYRWLVANAARFGFVPYAFEPWHWEYAGAAVASPDR